MRSFLAWFNARRRLVVVALIGLVALVVLSAGRTPEAGGWAHIPDLGNLVVFVLGTFALAGLVLIGFARPKPGRRTRGELRSLRAVLIFTLIIVAAAVLYGPADMAEQPPIADEQEAALVEPVGVAANTDSGLSGVDRAALALMVIILAAVVARAWRRPHLDSRALLAGDDPTLHRDLTEAVEEAHDRLNEETDPRTAVLLAYASLERALAKHGRERHPAETPSEHIARVLVDVPVLAAPAERLGGLYEVARFSNEVITERERHDAARALDRARSSLVVTERGLP